MFFISIEVFSNYFEKHGVDTIPYIENIHTQ